MLYIDFSISSAYETCNEKGRLNYIEHLQPVQIEPPLAFGAAIHEGIHAKYIAKAKGASFEQQLALAETAYLENIHSSGANLPIAIDNTSNEKRSVERGLNIIRAYMHRWRDEQLVPLTGAKGEPYVEIGFNVYLMDFKGEPVFLVGKMDRLMYSPMMDTIHVTDTKTTTSSLYHLQNSVKPNHQGSIYYHAAENILGKSISSVIFDGIYVSDRKPDAKKGGWFAEGVDIEKDFGRFPTDRTPTDVDEALRDLREIAYEFFTLRDDIRSGRRQRARRNAPAACYMYGGCRYRMICNTNMNDNVIKGNFVVQPWEPHPGVGDNDSPS